MFAAKNTAAPSGEAVYVESVFSTYLYTGNGSTQTITNNIDLSGKGGLVWVKSRSGAYWNNLTDTVRGAGNVLWTNSTSAATSGTELTAFNSNGFTLTKNGYASQNENLETYASWTFREQAKFFDVVTYTGNGTAGRTVAHNLGSVPGCVITKKTSNTSNWAVYHRGITSSENGAILLNSTDAWVSSSAVWNNTAPTSTNFTVGTADATNINGETYVAYLFAHNAGGFGASGSDNVISCGSFTQSSAVDVNINLGYEPQWLLIKRSDSTSQWIIVDDMRGFLAGGNTVSSKRLFANLSNAEGDYTIQKTSTGFTFPAGQFSVSAGTYIYIAIRRPMKTPTSGTSVFTPDASGNNASAGGLAFDAGFPVDWYIRGDKSGSNKFYGFTRLTSNEYLTTTSTAAGTTTTYADQFDSMTGIETTTGFDFTGQCAWLFKRAPGFFDVVCYTGNGSNRTITHNLAAVPELMIVKLRSGAFEWQVYSNGIANTEYLMLDSANAKATGATRWNSTTPTSSVFSLGTSGGVNSNGSTYVAYLFATVAGVSKVGSYTGTGTTQVINCGFTAGSRFVMIKRTDSAGDWYVWDSARGIVAGNDPYLLLNSTGAEVTNTDYVDTANSGFEISSTAPAAINANGGSFIFFAVA